jgi:hypothetical protein
MVFPYMLIRDSLTRFVAIFTTRMVKKLDGSFGGTSPMCVRILGELGGQGIF